MLAAIGVAVVEIPGVAGRQCGSQGEISSPQSRAQLDAGVAAGSEMAREEPRRARSAVHGARHLMLCFRAILLRYGGTVNLAVGVSSRWRGSSFSMIVGGVCMFKNLPFYTDYAFYGTPAAARSLSSLMRGVRVSRARLGRVLRTESVGTCIYGYCSIRLATSGHGYSSHRSWYLPKGWMLISNRVLERSRSLAPGCRTANRPIQQNVATGPKSRDEPIKKVIIWQLVPIPNTPRPQRTYDGQCHDGRALRTHI